MSRNTLLSWVEDKEPSTVTNEEPENKTCTRCNPFISNAVVAVVGLVVEVVEVVEEEEDDDDTSKPKASFICGTDSPVKLASLTTAAPRNKTQSHGIVSLRVVPALEAPPPE